MFYYPLFNISIKGSMELFLVKLRLFALISIPFFLISCTEEKFDSPSQYYSFINDPDNDLIKNYSKNGFQITVKYFPFQLLVLDELKDNAGNDSNFNSIYEKYSRSISFYFTIKPENRSQISDIHMWNIHSEEDYNERQHLINFQLDNYFNLNVGDEKLLPKLFNIESHAGISKAISGTVVFVVENNSAIFENSQLDLIFSDPVFNTGTSQFIFNKNDLDAVPDLKILHKHEN